MVDTLNTRIAELEKIEEERNTKIEELEKVIKTNENVINWLNKQINPEGETGKQAGLTSKRGGGRTRQPLSRVQVSKGNTKADTLIMFKLFIKVC